MGEPTDLERAVLADPALMRQIQTSRAQLAAARGVEDPDYPGLVFSPEALTSLPEPG